MSIDVRMPPRSPIHLHNNNICIMLFLLLNMKLEAISLCSRWHVERSADDWERIITRLLLAEPLLPSAPGFTFFTAFLVLFHIITFTSSILC